ncbi:MAG: sigma-70 family RNA polymerase sigma factor, partial [Planctomycetota bacterium]
NEHFATTQWSMVRDAGNEASSRTQEALEQLCQRYWQPLYAYVRRRGYSANDAQDLTQSFFLSLLNRNSIQTADPDRGRFRSFLLGGINNYLVDAIRRETAEKRGGTSQTLSFDFEVAEQRYQSQSEPVDQLTPERIYERAWAIATIEKVQDRLMDYYRSTGNEELLTKLLPHLSRDTDRLPYVEIARSLGKKEGAVKVAAHRLKQKYREILRDEILQTIDHQESLDDEVALLFKSLQH